MRELSPAGRHSCFWAAPPSRCGDSIPRLFLQIIEKERVSWVFVVPTMLQRILDLPPEVKKKYNLCSMHSLICAAAPATPELKQAANKFFSEQGCTKNVFMEFYGSSETAVASVLLPGDYEENQ